jgi:EAL domain-containing protein (putative c-di-GMP-specific phosphodiesterase class I)
MACADDGEDAETLVDNADLAMYVAKQAGRGRAVRFDRSLRTAVRERAGLEVELRQALERGGIEAFYQPVVRLGDAAVVGFEALARWRHPERGLIPPDVFVPIAEETGLIAEVDRRVLRDACGRIAAWNRVRPADPWSVSVNVSARTFADPGLPDEVAGALAHSGLAAGHLFLEITETVMMEEADSSVEVLERLTELGVRLAVDDFGTGYSSLRYLRDLPVAILKLDRSFVGGLGRERDDRAIVEAVVHLARSLRLSVTAEGVETPHQAAVLTALGCPYGQGFLFGRPVPADAIDPRPWRPALAAVATAGP